jgi:ethanolamine utilization protein EutJ
VSSPSVSALLGRAAGLLGGGAADVAVGGGLRAGVDLGTASCVLVVLDGDGEPVHVTSHPSGALADGVVVDFAAATRTVRQLREDAEQVLGAPLTSAATAYPPCIAEPDARACRFVCEAAGFDKVSLTDEVSAAQAVLGVQDGVIVDVGGGSTGVGIFRAGQLTELADQPGGGHHLDLVLAGAFGIRVEEAERLKRTDPRACLPHLVPCIERIGTAVRQMTVGSEDLPLHLAGGALMVPGAAEILGAYLGRETVSYAHALLITPFGIARCAP